MSRSTISTFKLFEHDLVGSKGINYIIPRFTP